MTEINYRILQPDDLITFQLIADWYLSEWNIPIEKTIERLKTITTDSGQFQALITLNNQPIATGGIYNHVGLLDKEPRFKIHKNWLALVYTLPENRNQGYGSKICKYVEEHAKQKRINTLYLFTDTAEKLYERLGWLKREELAYGQRHITVMNKKL